MRIAGIDRALFTIIWIPFSIFLIAIAIVSTLFGPVLRVVLYRRLDKTDLQRKNIRPSCQRPDQKSAARLAESIFVQPEMPETMH
jgi:hypothetical protein